MLTQKKIDKINTVLESLNNPKDVHAIYPLLQVRLGYLNRVHALKYNVGQKIEFTHNNIKITGIISRINRKTASLKDCSDKNPRGWRVPFTRINRIL